MRSVRLPGILAYATIAMWLLQVLIAPVRAESASPVSDHLAAIARALAGAGAPAGAKVALADPGAEIIVPDGAEPIFDSIAYTPANGRFLVRMRGAASAAPIAVSGTALATRILPVLSCDIARGAIIAENCLGWVETTEQSPQYLQNAGDIVGMEARRPLASGALVREIDVAAPLLIRKGDVVTVVLESPGIRLTQKGVALAAGAEGDLIEIENLNSEREIRAIVAAANLARVPSPGASFNSGSE